VDAQGLMHGRATLAGGVPIACGALGRFDPALVARIAAGLGGGLEEVHCDSVCALWLDREPIAWRGGDGTRGLAWSERLPARARTAGSWREAARAGACGLVVDGDRRAVHGSASGLGPIYWMTAGDAAYFATAIEALARARAGSISPDWESWASIVTLGYPCADGTPFAEIKRLDPLGTISAAPGAAARVHAGELGWAEVEPDDPPEAAELVVAALRRELDGLGEDRPLICPLTGGFDSRLLACLLTESDRDVSAFTVNNDLGHEREEELATAVAAALGVRHSVLETAPSEFADELGAATALVDHEAVLRLYLARLGVSLPDPDATVVDGFDIFLKNRFATPGVLEAHPLDVAATMFDEMTPTRARFGVFEPGAWEALRAAARARFVDGAEQFAGHPASPTLIPYWHRMRRGIGLSPMRLIGHRHQVALPLAADDLVRTALRVPQRAKVRGGFYRRVLELVNPSVARLPSTNDDLPRPERTRPRLERSPQARGVYLELLAESPLRPWFGHELEAAIERGKLGPVLRTGWGMGRVQALCNLTLWARRHGDLLSELDPRPMLGSP
jgi:Asparagine synthase